MLRPLIIKGLFKTEMPSETCDFKSWVSSGKYLVRSVPGPREIKMEINNDYAFSHMLAFDICRMATASFETMENINVVEILPKSYGWIAIKSYYAAFFAAHSIMRCFGYICSQLERGHIKLLNDYCLAMGLPNTLKPESGFFSGCYDTSTRMFSLKKLNNTHEDTWSLFVHCLAILSVDVLNLNTVSAKKQVLSSKIDDLIVYMKGGGRFPKGNFLSQFRNSVNYRHEYNSWHPYGKNAIQSEKIVALINNWKCESVPLVCDWNKTKDVFNFFYSCAETVNLCHKLVNIIVANSETPKNLYSRWPGKFLKLTSIA